LKDKIRNIKEGSANELAEKKENEGTNSSPSNSTSFVCSSPSSPNELSNLDDEPHSDMKSLPSYPQQKDYAETSQQTYFTSMQREMQSAQVVDRNETGDRSLAGEFTVRDMENVAVNRESDFTPESYSENDSNFPPVPIAISDSPHAVQQVMYPNVFRPAGIPRPSPVLHSVQTGVSPVYYSPQLMDTMPYPHPLQHMSPYYYPIQNNNLMPVQHHGSLPMNAYLPSPAPAYLSPIPSPFQTPSPQFYTPGSSPMDCMQIQPTLSPMYYPYPIAPGYRMEVPRGGIYVPTEYIGSSYASNRVFHGSDDTAVSPHYHQRLHDQVIILT